MLASVLVTAPAELREQIRPLPRERWARACADLACPPGADRQTRVLHQTLIRLGQRVAQLAGTAAGLEKQITEICRGHGPPGFAAAESGLGALSAAQILLSWSHAGRIASEAAFAMLSGTAPVPVSSGRTDRHRLNGLGGGQCRPGAQSVGAAAVGSGPADTPRSIDGCRYGGNLGRTGFPGRLTFCRSRRPGIRCAGRCLG